MTHRDLPPVCLVTSTRELDEMVEALLSESIIAIDTESNSLFAYRERVCLIQLSTHQQDYLIDPLSIRNMQSLGVLTEDPSIEIVFHAAEYDIICLKRDFDFHFNKVFDTMFAARILGYEYVGLGNLLESFFNVHLDKRFQRANWGLRPLSPEQIEYARMDTHYLLPLRDMFHERLAENGALTEAREIFADLTNIPPKEPEFDENGFWRIHTHRRFSKRQMACLRELYLWREDFARKIDQPPFKIMTNEVLSRLVTLNPQKPEDLYKSRILRKKAVQKYQKGILEALERGRKAKPPKRPRRQRVDMGAVARHDLLKQWRKERAAQRGVESDIIVPREPLWEIAKAAPQTLEELREVSHLGPWRLNKYGQEILQVLADND